MKTRTLFIFVLLLSICIQSVYSVPAVPWPIERQQPDGTIVEIYLRGDEKVNWMESLDGYTLMYDNDRTIVYAEKDEYSNLVPSSVAYLPGLQRSPSENQVLSSIEKGLKYSPAQVNTLLEIWKIEESTEINKVSVTGDKKALCILADFPDRPFSKTVAEFEALMNQVGYSANSAKGSVKDFYKENSYGTMDLTISVVGPVRLSKNAGNYTSSTVDSPKRVFAEEAIRLADDLVNFKDFANENNVLETVHIIYAGFGSETGLSEDSYIWAHKWQLASTITLDGVRISVYSCSPELRGSSGSTITSIGVICHELCHVFGAPDYYDTDYEGSGGSYPGTGSWDLMAGGNWNGSGHTPAHINMFQKILFGWVEAKELTSPEMIIDMPNSAENPVAYVIKHYTNNEQYVLENRQKVGFDTGVPGTGLLIYHVHNSSASGSVSNKTHPQQVYVVDAATTHQIPTSTVESYGSINTSSATFGSSAARHSFTTETTPAMFRWNGTTGTTSGVLDKPITEVKQSNRLISFAFKGGRDPYPCEPVSNIVIKTENNKAYLTWSAPANSDLADYTYSVYVNGTFIESGIKETAYVYPLNPAGGTVNFCIGATGDYNCESEQVCKTISVDPFTPCGPIEFIKADVSRNVITVTWDSVAYVTSYNLYKNNVLLAEVNGRSSYQDVITSQDNATYTYCVEIKNAACSNTKICADAVDYVFPYIPVSNLSSLPQDKDIITLTWTLDALVSYESVDVYRNGTYIGNSPEGATSYVDAGVNVGTYEYTVKVNYGNTYLSEAKTITVQVTDHNPYYAVVDFKAVQSKRNAELSWKDPGSTRDIEKFIIYKTNIVAEGQETQNLGEPLVELANNIFTYTDEYLEVGTYTYYIVVDYGNGILSPIETSTVEINYQPLAVESFSLDGVKDIELNAALSVAFNQTIYRLDTSLITLEFISGTESTISISPTVLSKQLRISHTPFQYETTYLLTIPIGSLYYMEQELKYQFTTRSLSGSEIEEVGEEWQVYPTLTDGPLHINAEKEAIITITDLSGRILDKYFSTGARLDVELTYSSGIYLVHVSERGKTKTSKIILNR